MPTSNWNVVAGEYYWYGRNDGPFAPEGDWDGLPEEDVFPTETRYPQEES